MGDSSLIEKAAGVAPIEAESRIRYPAPATDPIRDAVAMARGRVLVVDDIPMLNKLAAAMKPATDPCPHCNGEGCTPHLDRKGNVYPEPCQHCETTGRVKATDAAYTGGMNDLCVTDAAPAVCVWTNGFVSYENRKWWRAACGWSFYGKPPFVTCGRCGKPIKFTEANHG